MKIHEQGRENEHQRFISLLEGLLLAIGCLSLLSLEEDEELTVESEDMQCASNLSSLPPAWAGFFFSQRVPANVAGRRERASIGVRTLAMGLGAVDLVAAVARPIGYKWANIPIVLEERHDDLYLFGALSPIYLDGIDFISRVKLVQPPGESHTHRAVVDA